MSQNDTDANVRHLVNVMQTYSSSVYDMYGAVSTLASHPAFPTLALYKNICDEILGEIASAIELARRSVQSGNESIWFQTSVYRLLNEKEKQVLIDNPFYDDARSQLNNDSDNDRYFDFVRMHNIKCDNDGYACYTTQNTGHSVLLDLRGPTCGNRSMFDESQDPVEDEDRFDENGLEAFQQAILESLRIEHGWLHLNCNEVYPMYGYTQPTIQKKPCTTKFCVLEALCKYEARIRLEINGYEQRREQS